MVRAAPAVLLGGETEIGESEVLILKPKEWIGQDFPLHDAISPSINLTKCDCIVLLYHHDCPKCIEALARYKQLVKSAAEHGDDLEVVIVEVPPFGELEYETEFLRPARLSADKEWFVQAPVELQLRDGKVMLASLELPSIVAVP